MSLSRTIIVTCLLLISSGALPAQTPPPTEAVLREPQANPILAPAPPAGHRFPDFSSAYKPSEGEYNKPLFRLSQSYPTDPPALDKDLREILSIPFDENEGEENWRRYLLSVRDYCFDGNIDPGVDWRGQDNAVRKWYHVPWQHWGKNGREGIRGLTREAASKPRQLAETQTEVHQTYAVALYNPQGGVTLGKVWENQFEPNPKAAQFPIGTVVAKVLFTQANEREVPYLINPIEWTAYAQDPQDLSKRKVQRLRLIQMDVMVRDDRAPSGWVFGNFCYNGALGHADKWENLVPVGLQWGDDPNVSLPEENPTNPFPIKTFINSKLSQTAINLDATELPPQHLGWGGRLNGPVDYYRSSCMSCHSTAQYPQIDPQHPDFKASLGYQPGDAGWMKWFRNLDCGEPFRADSQSTVQTVSTDFSLQLAIGIQNFYEWKQEVMKGHFTPDYVGKPEGPRTEIQEIKRDVSE